MSPEWSSSTTIAVDLAKLGGQRLHPPRGCRDARRVVGSRLQEDGHGLHAQRIDELGDDRAFVVDVDTDHLGAELVEQIEQWRKCRVFDDHSIAESNDHLGDAIERVHRAVDDRQRLGRERPAVEQPLLELAAAPGCRGSSMSATAG